MYITHTQHRTSGRAYGSDELRYVREDEARRKIASSMTEHLTRGLQDVVGRIAQEMQGERGYR